MFGISEEGLIGKTDYEIVDRPLADFFRHKDREAIAAGRPLVNEEEIVAAADGTRATLRTIKTPMFGTDGKLIGVLGVGHDITSMLLTRQTLVESEQKYRTLVDSMGDGVFVAQDFQFVFANQAFASMLGRTIEETIGLGFADVVDDEFLEIWTTRFRQRIGAGPDPLRFYEVRFRRKDGTTFWIELRASRSVFNAHPAVLGSVRDITDRRRAETALRESEARFLKVFRANPAATCISRLDTGEIIDVNEAMQAMVGFSRDEMCGNTTTGLGLWGNPDVRQRVVDAVQQHGRQEAIEIEYRHKSGEPRICMFSGERIEIGGRQYLCSYATDITEQKRAEVERERLRAQLEQAQKMEAIGQVTGGVAHDFNNILAIILGYTDMLASSHLSSSAPPVPEYIGNIRQAAERGRELISKMMLFSRNQESKVTSVMSLRSAIEEVVAMLGPMISASIDVRTEIDDQAEPVLGGLVEIEQVLMNLSINARDAMDSNGRLSIRLERARRYQSVCSSCHTDIDGHFVSLSITDSGTGITEDTLKRMFDPFFTTKSVGHGTGLGLSMVHGILHRFSGHVIAESKPGAGTTFRLLFVPASTQDLASALRPAPVAASVQPAPAGGRVMVVDDEPQLCKLMTLILRKQGYEVVGHTDPQAALADLTAGPERFDLIITDQTMPGMSGTALAEAIRELRPQVPIILCSGFTERSAEGAAGSGPIDLHLEKPVSAATLADNVSRLLAARRGTGH
jgi:PAS domain S-box-containing protein